MTQQPDGIGDSGSRCFFSSSSTLNSDQHPEHPDDRPQTSSTNYTSSTLYSGATIDELTPSDVVIAVMGPTGAGKSTFINIASGTQQAAVGHSLTSCTQEIKQISYTDEGRGVRIVLVDTPGFDDTHLSDLETLRRISEWLEETHGQGILLSGILLFHRISDNRMERTPLETMKMFQDLCGKDALSNVMLVTTMWDEVTPEQGQQREEELRDYWQPMLAHGARMSRFRHTKASAHATVSHFEGCRRSLLVQDQMKKGKAWYETSAAATLLGPLAKLVKSILGFIRRLDLLIRKEKDPLKRLKLARKREQRQSSLTELLETRQSPSITTTLPDSVFGDQLQVSPTSIVAPPDRSLDILTEQTEELRRLGDLIPLSTLQNAVHQMLSIIDIIEELEPSDKSIVSLVERTGSLTIAFAGHVRGQPSVDDVTHTVDQFQKLLSQIQDRLQNMLTKHRRPRQPTSHPPDTVPKPAAQAKDPTTETPGLVPSSGRDTPDLLQMALVETTKCMEELLREIHDEICDQPRTVNVFSGGGYFDIHGDFRVVSGGGSSPSTIPRMVHESRQQSTCRPNTQKHYTR